MGENGGTALSEEIFAQYLRRLLRDHDAYRRRWVRHGAVAGRGRTVDNLNQTSIARAVFQDLVTRTRGETNQSVESLKHRIHRCIKRGRPCHEATLGWIIDAFDMEPEHTRMLWSLFEAAQRERALPETTLLSPASLMRLRTLDRGSRTLIAHEHHYVGPHRSPREHRTIQVVSALRDGIDRYPFAFDTSSAKLEVAYGGDVDQMYHLEGDVHCAEIAFGRTLRAGETHVFETLLRFHYAETPPPEFRRAVIGGTSTHLDLRVVFDPRCLPSAVEWATWSAGETLLTSEPAALDESHAAHRYVDTVSDGIVGFTWRW